MIKFVIPLNPVSKKNGMQIVINKKTGRPFLIPSKAYKEYEKQAILYIPKIHKPIDVPCNVKTLFFNKTRRKCDLVNMQEAVLDVMVKGGLIADDNYSIVQSMDGSRVLYDKNQPRTEVIISKVGGVDNE